MKIDCAMRKKRGPLRRGPVISVCCALFAMLLGMSAVLRFPASAQPVEEPPRIENPEKEAPPVMRSPPAPPAPVATLLLDAVGFKSDRGQAVVALFRNSKGFPKRIERAAFKRAFPISKHKLGITVENVSVGIVAAVVIHDENKDSVLDTNWFGFRLEGYGTSRDAQARIGSPEFYDAAISLKAGEQLYLRIPVRY